MSKERLQSWNPGTLALEPKSIDEALSMHGFRFRNDLAALDHALQRMARSASFLYRTKRRA
ncbi:hypothetical protein A3765_28585 [Oleiphilus sp. HI0130]|nr:hypothetical protein A3765_28870 [Oleiphilus sp. HI0130]KZZ72510.1 hypothetical protein A3765_28585 [Oleiphilus sp. HI0130]